MMQFPDSDFWDFSIEFYKKADVEQSCLSLQDIYSLNVNLILFCFWLGLNKKNKLEQDQWQQLILASLPWEEIILSLRQSRRMIKHSSIAWPPDFKQETSSSVSKIELNTERMQQLSIEQAWNQLDHTVSDDTSENIIRHNIGEYLQASQKDTTLANIEKDLSVLLNSATNT